MPCGLSIGLPYGRFRQSHAKTLLRKSPAHLLHELTEERRKPTNAMRRGTLIDQLVFGQRNYHTVSATYASGPRKGEQVTDWTGGDARAQRKDAEERGQIAVLEHEIDAAREIAGGIRAVLLREDIELADCLVQTELEWDGPHGVACRGTPDLYYVHRDGDGNLICIDTIDLKIGENADPEWLDNHVYAMGWHIQGAAYQEAVHAQAAAHGHVRRGTHWLLVAEVDGPRCITFQPLSEAYMDLGREDWSRACAIWQQCVHTGVWPEYEPRPIHPSNSVMWKAQKV